jgi:hypothetical protein
MSHNNNDNILVLGAGELGMAVLRSLSQHVARAKSSTQITVFLRPGGEKEQDSRKQKEIEEIRSLKVSLEFGNLATDSIDTLVETFRRFDTIICCTGFAAGRGTQRKVTQAVLKAEVKRYIPWQFGVDYDTIGRNSPQDLFDEQLDVRDLLRSQQRTEWIIISTGMFTSFLFEPFFGVVDLENSRLNALGSLDTATTVTTPDDIGVLTTEILFAEPRIANQVVFVAGDTITFAQLADLLERITGKRFERNVWTVDYLIEELSKDKDNNLNKYRAVFAQGKGVAWDKSITFNAQHAIKVTTAEEWAKLHLKIDNK